MTAIDEATPTHTESTRTAHHNRGVLGRVPANSRLHWLLLGTAVAGSVMFTLTFLVDGLLRAGYDSLRQPMSALSLGSGGWVQVSAFVLFGLTNLAAGFAWRATLSPGLGAVWYPRLRIVIGFAMIGAGVLTQDPGQGYPVGVPAPAAPTLHAIVHTLLAFVSLIATVTEQLILARRFAREPRWARWAPALVMAAVAMMVFLAIFGALMTRGGPAGLFEKLASATATLVGLAVFSRLAATHDARISIPA